MISKRYVSRVLRLTLLAPDFVEAILDSREPDGLFLEYLRRGVSMAWDEQRRQLYG